METMTKSPRRLKEQVKDTVGEQVRDLPLHAVRLAMFGVGRALLLSDRITKDYKEITEGGGVRPVIGRLREDVQSTAGKVVGRVTERVRGRDDASAAPAPTRPESRSESGPAREEISVGKPTAPAPDVRPEPDAAPEPQATAAPDVKDQEAAEPEAEQTHAAERPADAKPEFEPRPERRPAAQGEAEKLAADLPVPNYDDATLPQLRARLRGLSVDQVKLLREYERDHAARPDVLKMYENRIAKLNGMS
jgi:hypothetical protein